MKVLTLDFPEEINRRKHCESETCADFMPHIDAYIRDDQTRKTPRPAMIVCPGGGYHFCSVREAEPLALKFSNEGFQVFIVWYSVNPAPFPEPLLQVAYTVKLVRSHAEEWNIHPEKVFVAGSSAGGHLAATLSTYYHKDFVLEPLRTTETEVRPTGVILSYPVITSGEKTHQRSMRFSLEGADPKYTRDDLSLENHVTEKNVPTFIWATMTDENVPVENTLCYIHALHEKNIPMEAHLFPIGRHGLSLCDSEVSKDEEEEKLLAAEWVMLAIQWARKFL